MQRPSQVYTRCPECGGEFPVQPGRLRLAPHPARGPSGQACAGTGRLGEWVAPRFDDHFSDTPRRTTG